MLVNIALFRAFYSIGREVVWEVGEPGGVASAGKLLSLGCWVCANFWRWADVPGRRGGEGEHGRGSENLLPQKVFNTMR